MSLFAGKPADYQSCVVHENDGSEGRSVIIACNCGVPHSFGLSAVNYQTFAIQFYCAVAHIMYSIVPNKQMTEVFIVDNHLEKSA